MVRLVVSDIDGTLIGRDGIIPVDAVESIRRLRSGGVHFSLATGRSDCMTMGYVHSLECDVPCVTCNGATIIGPDGHVHQRLKFPISSARSVIDLAVESGIAVIYTVDGQEYHHNPQAEYFASDVCWPGIAHRLSEDEWHSLQVDKISMMSSHDDLTIAKIEAECVGMADRFSFTRYMDRSVELVAPGVSKASGVARLASMLGIPMSDVMFVGDHQNDIPLMQASGIGVAVGNATVDAKENADYVCSGALFEGVLEAMDRFVFKEIS